MAELISHLPFCRTPPHGPLASFLGHFSVHINAVSYNRHCPQAEHPASIFLRIRRPDGRCPSQCLNSMDLMKYNNLSCILTLEKSPLRQNLTVGSKYCLESSPSNIIKLFGVGAISAFA